MSDKLTAAEAIHGFVGWLTIQPDVVKMGAGEDCSPVCEAIKVFCKVNHLDDPREGWANNLIHPDGECSGPSCRTASLDKDIECLINKHSREQDSNTPDFILAEYLMACLGAFEVASNRREGWYSVEHKPGERTADARSV